MNRVKVRWDAKNTGVCEQVIREYIFGLIFLLTFFIKKKSKSGL